MTTSENKAIAKRFIEALGKGDVNAMQTVIAPDLQAVCTGTSLVSGTRTHDEICAVVAAMPHMTRGGIDFSVISMTAEEDRVSCEFEGRSELVNGQSYNNQYHFLFVIRDGQVVHLREYMDTRLADERLAPLLAQAGGQ